MALDAGSEAFYAGPASTQCCYSGCCCVVSGLVQACLWTMLGVETVVFEVERAHNEQQRWRVLFKSGSQTYQVPVACWSRVHVLLTEPCLQTG